MDTADLMKIIEKKVNEIKYRYLDTLRSLIGLIEEELETLKPILPMGRIRFIAEVENKNRPENQVKSIESIVEKIKNSNGKYTCDNFSSEMTDILRGRIICNYISDIGEIAKAICSSKNITQQFKIIDEKDTIYGIRMSNLERVKGVRAYYLVFEYKEDAQCPKIEIQIMTMLAFAWDKKDHYLIYEQERKGINVSPLGKIKMNAMSELLYVADEFFDSIQKELSQTKGVISYE